MTLQENIQTEEIIKIENDLKKLKIAIEKVKDQSTRKKLIHLLHKLEKKLADQQKTEKQKRNLTTIYTVALPFIAIFALLGGYYLVKNKELFKK